MPTPGRGHSFLKGEEDRPRAVPNGFIEFGNNGRFHEDFPNRPREGGTRNRSPNRHHLNPPVIWWRPGGEMRPWRNAPRPDSRTTNHRGGVARGRRSASGNFSQE